VGIAVLAPGVDVGRRSGGCGFRRRRGGRSGRGGGFGVAEFRQVGHLIADVLDGIAKNGPDGDAQVEAQVRGKVRDLCARFPIYRD